MFLSHVLDTAFPSFVRGTPFSAAVNFPCLDHFANVVFVSSLDVSVPPEAVFPEFFCDRRNFEFFPDIRVFDFVQFGVARGPP